MQQNYHKRITAKHRLLDLKLKEVWKYRELIGLFTKRNVTVGYRQTILGPLWLFINPLLTSIVHLVVFGRIAKLGTEGVPQLLFYLSGNALWAFFSSSGLGNAGTFLSNEHLFGKVYFPRLTIPISVVLSSAIKYAIQMILVFGLLIYYVIAGSVSPNYPAWPLIPVILIWLGLMAMGVGIIISSLTIKYRDLSVLVSFGMQLWLYASPVVYPLSTLSGTLKSVMLFNPVTAPIELYRYALLGVGTVTSLSIAVSVCFTALVLLLGVILFNKVERNFIDTV